MLHRIEGEGKGGSSGDVSTIYSKKRITNGLFVVRWLPEISTKRVRCDDFRPDPVNRPRLNRESVLYFQVNGGAGSGKIGGGVGRLGI